jgi:hypothetical protein
MVTEEMAAVKPTNNARGSQNTDAQVCVIISLIRPDLSTKITFAFSTCPLYQKVACTLN